MHLMWGASLLITLLVYGSSLNLPFFFDDLDHMPYVAQTGLIDIWLSSGGFPYYRPLGATVWRLSYVILGENNPVVLHGINLLFHGVNGWLVSVWYRQLQGDKQPLWPFIAAVAFLLYPFTYQAVPWIGALYHILATTLILSALVLYGQNGRFALYAALFCAFLAPFAHENGIIIWPMILITMWFTKPNQTWAARAKEASLWFIPLLTWGIIWRSAPKVRGDGSRLAINHAEAIWQNGAYFLQGFGYPLTWTGGWLRDNWGLNDLGLALGLTALLLMPVLIALRQNKRILIPLALFLGGSLPAVALLEFAYVISAPRLQAVPSIGTAVVWVMVLQTLYQTEKPLITADAWQSWKKIIGGGILLIVLSQNLAFIQKHMRQHQMLGQSWQDTTQFATQTGAESNKLPVFINLPSSITAPQATYPLGHEGTVFMVSYIPLDRILPVQTNQETLPYALRRQDDIRPEMPYLYGVMGDGRSWAERQQTADNIAVYNTIFSENRIDTRFVGETLDSVSTQNIGIFPELSVYLYEESVRHTSDGLEIPLIWQTNQTIEPGWTIFVHVLNDQGALIAQADGQAWDNTFPVNEWEANSILRDIRYATVDANQAHTIHVGFYNWVTGERATAQPHNTQETADHLPLNID